jgi:hypothetical protein
MRPASGVKTNGSPEGIDRGVLDGIMALITAGWRR